MWRDVVVLFVFLHEDDGCGVETPHLVAIGEGTIEGTHGRSSMLWNGVLDHRRSANRQRDRRRRGGSFLKRATIAEQLRSYVSSYVQPDESTSCERGQRVSSSNVNATGRPGD